MDKLQKELATSEIFHSARQWLHDNQYIELTVPRIVRASGSCENVNTLYNVLANGADKWYGSPAYLAQTGQLYLEAYIPKLKKVFCDGPSFRAEETIDDRHLTEFRMIEIELETDFNGLLDQIQGFINHLVSSIIYLNESKQLNLSEQRIAELKKCPKVFNQLTYDQAIIKLQENGIDIKWGDDFKHTHEILLVELNDNQPLFITRFPDPMTQRDNPIEVEKFFNMLPDNENVGRVLSCDCILPYSGESVGAAERISNVETMVSRLQNSKMFKRLQELGGSIEDFAWYINKLKTDGSVPHAGCGFGMARILQFIFGETDIRRSVTFASNKESLI